MTTAETEQFKAKLLDEKSRLEREVGEIGRKDRSNPAGWDATSGRLEVDPADENEVADKLEELEENTGIVSNLERELDDVNAALDRIAKGTYGQCEACGKPIEIERLQANPSARTSLKHGHK